MINFLRKLINYFDTQNVSYMLSGSVAMSLYTEPRFTKDYDFIVNLHLAEVSNLLENFGEGYYCDKDAVEDAIKRKGMFNIIDHQSGYKADFVILKDEEYRRLEFERRRPMHFLEMNINVVSPEDLLISKIIWIQELQSAVQKEDIKLLSQHQDLDWKYINTWIEKLKLNTFALFPK
jgi:hypothetical protein